MIDPKQSQENKSEIPAKEKEEEVQRWLINRGWRTINCIAGNGVPYKLWAKDGDKPVTRIIALRKEVKKFNRDKGRFSGEKKES